MAAKLRLEQRLEQTLAQSIVDLISLLTLAIL